MSGFTHKEIRTKLGYGGSPTQFLLFDRAKGQVTAACLSKDKNPGAPKLVWVGPGKTRLRNAHKLITQQKPISVFTKERNKDKHYELDGQYVVSNSYDFKRKKFSNGFDAELLQTLTANRTRAPNDVICIVLSEFSEYEDFQARIQEMNRLSNEDLGKELPNIGHKPKKHASLKSGYDRSPAVVSFVLRRAKGLCEGCEEQAPFSRGSNGEPYLEVHHKTFLSEGGADDTDNAIALCPNCHRREHFGQRKWKPTCST